MKKIFLTSKFVNVADYLGELLPKKGNRPVVAFVPTAADVYEDKYFVQLDKDKLSELGFDIAELPLKDVSGVEIEKVLEKSDAVFVEGGNSFYLLDKMRESGFGDVVKNYVDEGLVYVGVSAGSYVACPTIEMAGWKHQDRNIVGMTDFTALALVPFLLTVHYTPEFDESIKQGMASAKYPLKILTDEQGLIIEGENVRLVGKGGEINF